MQVVANGRRRTAKARGLVCVWLALWGPAVAQAGEEGTSPTAALHTARQAFLAGRKLLDQGRYSDAVLEFEAAIAAKPTAGLYYYAAYCYEQTGRLLRARESYRRAAELDREAPSAELTPLLQPALERVEAALPEALFSSAPEGAIVTWQGEEIDPTSAREADPGSYEVSVEAPGHESKRMTVVLTPGAREVVRLELTPLPGAPAPAPAFAATKDDQPGRPSARDVALWSSIGVLGAGVVTGAVGVGLYLVGDASSSDASARLDDAGATSSSACGDPSRSVADDCDALASGIGQRDLGGTLMIAGLTGAAVGGASALLIHFLWSDAPVDVEVAVAPGLGTLRIRGEF